MSKTLLVLVTDNKAGLEWNSDIWYKNNIGDMAYVTDTSNLSDKVPVQGSICSIPDCGCEQKLFKDDINVMVYHDNLQTYIPISYKAYKLLEANNVNVS